MPTFDPSKPVINLQNKKRAYDKLRTIIENHGGKMAYVKGHNYWEVCMNGKIARAHGTGGKSFPDLDKFFVPTIPNPSTWDPYKNELVPGAEASFLAWINQEG